MSLTSFFKQMFGSGESASTKHAQTHTYKEFTIQTNPTQTAGGYRVNGVILQGEKSHEFIRADMAHGLESAHALTLSKAKQAIDQGIKQTEITINGPGAGRETAIRTIQASGIQVTLIKDITPTPHNGCRPPKKRRV